MKRIYKIFLFVVTLAVLCVAAGNIVVNSLTRLPHADESEQATIFSKLDACGEYKYSPLGSHGPTLYYYTNFAKKYLFSNMFAEFNANAEQRETISVGIMGEKSLEIALIRLPLLVFFILSLLTFFLMKNYTLGAGLGAIFGATSFALSSLAGVYSAYFVQETMFAFFVFAFANIFFLFLKNPSAYKATLCGIFAGLSQSTKETFPIFFVAIIAAGILTTHKSSNCIAPQNASLRNAPTRAQKFAYAGVFASVAIFVCALFYTSFGKNPSGLCDMFSSYSHFLNKAEGAGHASGFFYYFSDLLLLKKSEGVWFGEFPIAILALFGAGWAFLSRAKTAEDDDKKTYARYAAIIAILSVLAFSVIPYKTPWLMLTPVLFICTLSGAGAAVIVSRKKLLSQIFGAAFVVVLLTCQFLLERNAVIKFPNDPRNPFIYAHTTTGISRAINRVSSISEVSEYGKDTPVAVVMSGDESPWPLPWYFAEMGNVGFWKNGEFPKNYRDFEIILVDTRVALPANFDDASYVEEFGGLRRGMALRILTKKNLFRKLK